MSNPLNVQVGGDHYKRFAKNADKEDEKPEDAELVQPEGVQ